MSPDTIKQWHTAAELADLGLPGLSPDKRVVNKRALAEHWADRAGTTGEKLARRRQARGGGVEYHVDVLPAAARAAIAARQTVANDEGVTREARTAATWKWFDGTNTATKVEAKHRLDVVQRVELFEAAGMTRSAAVAAASDQSGVGQSTLWSWLTLIDGVAPADRLPALAPRRAGGCIAADIDPGAWQFFVSDYLRPERPTLTSCYRRMMEGYAAPRGLIVPVEKTFRRRLEREVPDALVIAKREGAEALRRTLPAQQRSVAELSALEAVNIDGHKFDVFVRHADGRVGRVVMVAIQDLYSRKFLAWRIAESESAILTRLAFADLFERWGIPAHCVLDNGRAFASKWITGGAKTRFRFKVRDDEPIGLLTALGVKVHWTFPYRGQSKPIERGFRDLASDIAKHPAMAGAYTGNRPDAKPENYGNAAIPIADFVAHVAAEIRRHNAREGRRTEMARGRLSYDQVFDPSYAASPIGRATPEQLRLALLMAEDVATDRNTGAVTLVGNRYWTPELSAVAGERVILRFDPEDLHRPIHVYDRAGGYIGAAPAIEATGFFDMTAAKTRARQEADLRRMVREQGRLADLIDAQTLAAMIPALDTPDVIPSPTIIRPVRHRGQTAAALKPHSDAAEAPLVTPVIDRLAMAALRLRIVE